MKTTVKVSISGIAFTIDEDAYNILNNYLNTLKKHFNRKADGKEVVDDIEARLAELLSMRVKLPERVVTLTDAQEVIRIMGNPSDLIGDDEQASSTESKNTQPPTPPVNVRKRLYRDPDNKVVAGVCGGLGNYFKIDPVAFRIIFIMCAIGVGVVPFFFFHSCFFPLQSFAIWTYIILWIAVPKASTPQRKLEMLGKNPSIDDIERKVRTEQANTVQYQPQPWGIANFIVTLVRIFIAGLFLIIGIALLLALLGVTFGVTYFNGFHLAINDVFDIVGINSIVFKIALAIAILYPLSMLIYWGAKLIFRFKLRDKMVMIIAFCIWIISLFYLVGYVIGGIWAETETRKTEITGIDKFELVTKSDTLYVNLQKMYEEQVINDGGRVIIGNMDDVDNTPCVWLGETDGMKTLFVVPAIKVRYSSNITTFRMELHKRTVARNKQLALRQIQNTPLAYTQNDSLLLITPLKFNKNFPLRKLHDFYDIIIYAPVNKKVIIQEPLLSSNLIEPEQNSWILKLNID